MIGCLSEGKSGLNSKVQMEEFALSQTKANISIVIAEKEEMMNPDGSKFIAFIKHLVFGILPSNFHTLFYLILTTMYFFLHILTF